MTSQPKQYTDSQGAPHPSPFAYQRAGANGPLLLQDFHLIDLLSHFDRERIPERVVHAKGGGAHGVFEVTDDITDLTCASLFSKVGNKAPATARFSTVGGESGSADTARDPRGFSVKIKTDEGVWDNVFNNTPVFFLRDPTKFPVFIHTQKRNPQTNLKDADAFWDYLSANPESIHQVMILFSDRGTPASWRKMHGYSGHAFKFVNAKGDWNFVQIHYKSDQGISELTDAEATKLAGENPDFSQQDLYDAIARGEHPSWTVYVQVMSPQQAAEFRYDVNDLTKIWPQKEFPLRRIGKFTLNKNVENYFTEIEQVAFAPSHLVPGIEPSNDPVLQSRLFSYPDTHRHRLGPNYQQLPVNQPINQVANFQRAGPAAYYAAGSLPGNAPNYPSATASPVSYRQRPYDISKLADPVKGSSVTYTAYEVEDLDYEQPRVLWQRVFNDTAKDHFVSNVVGHLRNVKNPAVKQRQVDVFAKVDPELGRRIGEGVGVAPNSRL